MRVPQFLNKPFLWFIAASIYFAYMYPEIGAKGGFLKPEITVKYVAVVVIFFLSGVSLKSTELKTATYQFQIHLFIQLYSMLFIPLIVQIFAELLEQFFPNPHLLVGFVIVSCMPPPVSSAVLLTKTAGGNEAAAVFNSALGSFLGIFITPALLYVFFSGSGEVPIWGVILQLSMTVVLPVIIGQLMRIVVGSYFERHKKRFSTIGSFMLLLVIYTTFCDTFAKHDTAFTMSTVITTSVAVILLQLILLGIAFGVASNLTSLYTPEDVVAILYCSTHKSLTLGFPMLKVLYENHSQFGLISFPLLIYHPMQILLGSILIPFIQQWALKAKRRYKSKSYPL
ncbi:sodium/bile acid cotransporter 7-like [Stegodyphus dumicola]|uniref:sodium/bile acid cotransporter 7-like n=1 Tax=Stegodyphus dumicola TaxID=202533 RepID=UPI0015AFDDF2|nr:sodium/bile acid cotransporter 7-like [Stegodyphus dumicola]XP_035207686.1 sodium/bile acid cotransporter 7-like [Stegodyphus dumicola]